jgi:hypothetical protein
LRSAARRLGLARRLRFAQPPAAEAEFRRVVPPGNTRFIARPFEIRCRS